MQPEEQQIAGIHSRMPVVLVSTPAHRARIETAPAVWDSAQSLDDDATRWLMFLDSAPLQPLSRLLYSLYIKRLFDVAAASIMLVMAAPLLILVALAIRLESRGQVIYRQPRVGRNGTLFTIYKFRTMIPDRRQRAELVVLTDRRKQHKSKSDPRVTRIGRFLRRSSIDELPQLFNILKGNMSFVGPRPEMPEIVEKYQEWQHQRHLVTPGLSGWWQVTGRSDLPMHEHTDLDIYYVVHQSFMLDLKIVLRTFKAVLSRGGAF